MEVLARMASGSAQMCVTSPPYWGLRDYGIPGRAWGGDPHHPHEWYLEIRRCATNHTDKRRWTGARNGRGEEQPVEGWRRAAIPQGRFCECGSWFGVLGLEPTPELYVAHIVEIFREVRRVLKDDGTLWLNLGDCYATGGGKANQPGGGYRGAHDASPKHRQVPDSKNPAAGIPTYQPNRMPLPGLKPKDLVGMPWRVAFALQADGWYLRSDIIWHKPNPMPESVTDRPTKSHEYLFLLAKGERYFYDQRAIQEPCSPDTHARYARGRSDNHKYADGGPGGQTIATNNPGSLFYRGSGNVARKLGDGTDGRLNNHLGRNVPWTPGVNPKAMVSAPGSKQNAGFCAAVKDLVPARNKRTVWRISTKPYKGAHFATYPPALVTPCILAGSRPGDVVLDPFAGSGTTLAVARELGREFVGIELKPEYVELAEQRLAAAA